MKYSLTDKQQRLARWIAEQVDTKKLDESFFVVLGYDYETSCPAMRALGANNVWIKDLIDRGNLEALSADGLVRIIEDPNFVQGRAAYPTGGDFDPQTGSSSFVSLRCTVTGKLKQAVSSNFSDEESRPLISSFAQPHPPEIAMSLDRLREKYPDAKKLGFLVMRFAAAKPFARIVKVIKEIAATYDIEVIRADENEFHAELWGNVRTHLHGCGFGIAVYERIETNEPNANVGLEVGYLMAMNKPVLLLKDKTIPTLQADLAGKLYKDFDPHDPEGTIPSQLTKWLESNGIALPTKNAAPNPVGNNS